MNKSYSKSLEEFSQYTSYSIRHFDFNSWQYVHVGVKMEVRVVSTSRVCIATYIAYSVSFSTSIVAKVIVFVLHSNTRGQQYPDET
jgi:hypothetical protein